MGKKKRRRKINEVTKEKKQNNYVKRHEKQTINIPVSSPFLSYLVISLTFLFQTRQPGQQSNLLH